MNILNLTSWSILLSDSVLEASDGLDGQALSLSMLASSENVAEGVGDTLSIFLLSRQSTFSPSAAKQHRL